MTEKADSYTAQSNGIEIEISKEIDGGIQLHSTTSKDESIGLELPFISQADDASIGENRQLEFENKNDTSTSVLPYEEGSVQIVTTIENSNAPTEYPYNVQMPDDAKLVTQVNGSILIVGSDEDILGGIAPAWAQDTQGKNISTHFEINGSQVTQIVEHKNSEDIVYPVIADPFLGKNLFVGVYKDSYNGDARYNARVSGWGALVLSGGGIGVQNYLEGQRIMNTKGWDELKSKYSAITNKPTLKQQYNCHVAAGTVGLPFTGAYNLERFRSNRPDWIKNVHNHRCNW